MRSVTTSLRDFFDRLRSACNRVLILDYDGTLAPFQVERYQAYPYPGIPEILDRIRKTGGCRLVVVTGRTIRDILPLLSLDHPPEIWGSHGRERLLRDGSHEIVPVPDDIREAIDQARSWAEDHGLGKRIEVKPGCLALHVRGMDSAAAQALIEKVGKRWRTAFEGMPVDIHPFDGGIELRTGGCDKGRAVETILAESGPDACAAYLGDDLTDEDAFRAMKGRGLSVLVRPEYRETGADLWIRPPEGLIDFLARWEEVCTVQVPK